MGCIKEIFLGLCLVAVALATGSNHLCYKCTNESSDNTCNADGAKTCGSTHTSWACYIYYHRHNGRVEISKKCIPSEDCIRPLEYVCNYDFSQCSYCCPDSLCNYKTPTKPVTEAPAKGDRGPKGWPGPKGPTGGDGPWGPLGPPGPPGPTGPDGSLGPPGFKGCQGKRGPEGSPGLDGPPGGAGLPGPPGPNGLTGAKGPLGWEGDKGYKGHPGDRGERGVPGAEGVKGPNGPKGYQGHAGIGTKGQKGDKGDGGPDATDTPTDPGPDGDIGWPGVEGNPGIPGHPGIPQTCVCESQPIMGFSVWTWSSPVDGPTVPGLFILYSVVITDVNTFPGEPMLDDAFMLVTATLAGVFLFEVTAVSICDLAWDIAIVTIIGGNQVVVVHTGRTINDGFNPFPVGTAHVSLCLEVGDAVGVIARDQVPPQPGYSYPTPSDTDVYFTGCLLNALPGGYSCP